MAKPLNALYGKGASAALVKTLPDDPETLEVEIPHDGVKVYVKWPRSEMKMDCYADRVYFLHLKSGRKGLYGEVCEAVEAYFKPRGVERFYATGADVKAEKILMKRGGWEKAERGRLVWTL